MIQLNSVYKIFGKDPEKALNLLREGKKKNEIYSQTQQVVAVNNVTFEVQAGETFVVMGLSGSGKSTLLRCINRLVEPTRGKIYLKRDGEKVEITSLNPANLRKMRTYDVTMVFQNFALFPRRSVLYNVTFNLEIQKKPKGYRRKKALETLELVGLKEWANSYPPELSGGMQQRVGLARALATRAEILLMDEPFSALDPLIRIKMQDELLELRSRLRRTIFFVTHDLDEALKLGDRIAIMEEGEIVQIGTPEQIILNPQTEYVADFVKNADPSGVLTAGKIINKIKGKTKDTRYYSLDKKSSIILELDKKNHPIKVMRSDEVIILRDYHDIKEIKEEDKQNCIFVVPEHTVLREIMKVKIYSNFPLIIVSQERVFKGIITEKDILQVLLKKGRKERY